MRVSISLDELETMASVAQPHKPVQWQPVVAATQDSISLEGLEITALLVTLE
jgi:hypothetical protein